MLKRIALLLVSALLIAAAPGQSQASQGSCVMPTSGTVSGLTLVQDMNLCFGAQQTANSGATAPTNIGPALGMMWLDTSTNFLKVYDGSQWLQLGHVDTSGHFWNPPIGGGTSTVASATATDLCSVPQSVVTISGSTTIAGFSNTCQTGTLHPVLFSGVLTMTHSSSLLLPNAGSDIVTAAGDRAWALYLGSGNWEIVTYQRADGKAISSGAVFTGAVFFDAPITASVAVNTNDWAPTGLVSANVIRVTFSNPVNVTGLLAPATDGQVVVIDNVGATNTGTLTSQDSGSSAANRFAFLRPMALRPGQSIALKYDAAASRWRLLAEITSQPVAGGRKNLVTTNGATPNTDLNITADELTVEDSAGNAVRLSSINVTAASGSSGANGLDTGSMASATWYSTWVIFNPTTNTVAGLLSVSATSPTMPSGYTYKVRTAWIRTGAASTNFTRIKCFSNRCQYVVTAGSQTATYPLMGSGSTGGWSSTTPSWTAVALGAFVPTTAAGIYVSGVQQYNAGSISDVDIAPNNSFGGRGSTNPGGLSLNGFGNQLAAVTPALLGIESSNIYWSSSASGAALICRGWEDNL